ncbi:TrkH family potassium uptake protein [Roseivivax sp. CAU 1761]
MALIGIRAGISRRALRLSPPKLLGWFYLVVVLLGGLLLWTPWASTAAVGPVEALFTATSAVTVTGLVVVQTGADFTWFGQLVILLLMQLGGLGLVTFAVFILASLNVPIGLGQRLMLREDLNQTSIGDLIGLVRIVFTVALGCEAVGAALLALVFVPDFGWAEGLWAALFHAVSAFNNAGFSIWDEGLMAYSGDPLVNLVVPALFLVGGLGFVVLADLWRKRRWRRLMLHSKIMLAGTLLLSLGGWAGYAALEWTNPGTLGQLDGLGARLWASWFQGLTPRTAGFNTLDTAAMRDSTALLTMGLMVIGAGSTSTAGGIKVTTFAVLILATYAFFRRRAEPSIFGRSLNSEEVGKVLALTTVAMLSLFLATFALSISHDGGFLEMLFEVCSAFGTVGLSMGATPELDTFGRLVIMAMMFLGRVGPLTLGFLLATYTVARVRYPHGRVFLG